MKFLSPRASSCISSRPFDGFTPLRHPVSQICSLRLLHVWYCAAFASSCDLWFARHRCVLVVKPDCAPTSVPSLCDFASFDKQIIKVTLLRRPLYPLNPNILRSISYDDAVPSISQRAFFRQTALIRHHLCLFSRHVFSLASPRSAACGVQAAIAGCLPRCALESALSPPELNVRETSAADCIDVCVQVRLRNTGFDICVCFGFLNVQISANFLSLCNLASPSSPRRPEITILD